MFKKYSLEIIVFISGISVMVVELDGSRVIAPFFGTSLYVWTSIIGVILGSLSLGYYLGGKTVDRNPKFATLGKILFFAGLSIGAMAIFKDALLQSFQEYIKDVRLGSLVSSVVFFGFPNVLLGMVSPFAAKLKIKALDSSGTTVGSLYAISTVGSIVGTFLAGFYLIPAMGNSRILLLVSAILIITSFYAYLGKLVRKLAIVVMLFLFAALGALSDERLAQAGYLDKDSQYNRILVSPSIDQSTGRPIRTLYTDPFGIQSAIFADKDDDLVFRYSKYFRLAPHFNPSLNKALMIGGGAYTFPRDFLKKNPNSTIDVVEIDPEFTKISKQFFNLEEDPRMNIIHEDGRTFLNRNTSKYDVVYIDTFKSITPPFQLTTKEAVGELYESLNENGLVMINLISSIDGPNGSFLKALNSTYKAVFKQVYIFPNVSKKEDLTQNIVMVALKSDKTPEFKSSDRQQDLYLSHLYEGEVGEGLLLTDEYAPVENLMQSVYAHIQ